MKKRKYTGYIIGFLFILIGLVIIFSYNKLVFKEEVVSNKWAEVQSTYQRRLDLIPNLVNVVKGVSDFEQTTLEQIAAARAKAASVNVSALDSEKAVQNLNESQNALAGATNRMIIQIEKYPTLKGTKAYSGLQTQLEGTERRIKYARNDFNSAVAEYNNLARRVPVNIVAKLFGFKVREGFEAMNDKFVEVSFK